MVRKFKIGLLLALCSGGAVAPASVTFFDIFKTADYVQVSDSQPTTELGWRFDARIFTDTDDDATSGTLTMPDGSTRPLSAQGSRLVAFSDGYFSSSGDLDLAYPSGKYGFSIDSGNLAGQTGAIAEPGSDYPNEVPYLTNGGYSSLQNVNANNSTSLTWNTFTHSGGGDTTLIFFDIFDRTDNVFVFNSFGDASTYLGDTIGANTFIAGHSYTYTLFYSVRFSDVGEGFNGASPNAGFDLATSGEFNAVPEPFTVVGLSTALVLFWRRKKA